MFYLRCLASVLFVPAFLVLLPVRACLAAPAVEYAGSDTDHLRYFLDDAQLNDVVFVDRVHGWAVGTRGAIYHTANGGQTWRLQNSGVDCTLESVTFLDKHTGWAVGGVTQPYSHRAQGVVLRTLDGGRRWTKMTGSMLPTLKSVKFFSPTRGWAVGSPSSLYGGGVFHTTDGGRSWSPVNAPSEHWLCADFLDESAGALAGRNGRLSIVATKGAIKSRTPDLGLRAVRDLKLNPNATGWLAGDGGLVMTTADGGLSWQLPARAIPAAARHEIDFTSVATSGEHVWAVGSPGALVLHSPDGGHSWELQRTGQSIPLHGVTFRDEFHGWAVGALGTILHTADGGRSWQRQRSGGTRLALLCIVADEQEIPLELMARLGGDEGYLCVAKVVGRRGGTKSVEVSPEDRIQDAFVVAGGSCACRSWQFPVRGRELLLSEDRVVELWNHEHDGRAIPILKADLVRTIRTWRPDVIVTSSEAATTAEGRIVGELVREANRAAADTTMFSEQLTHADLHPWQAKKVFTICGDEEVGDVSVSSAALALRLGTSLADYTAKARGCLQTELRTASPLTEFRLHSHSVARQSARRDFFSGLHVPSGGEARRRIGEVQPGNVDALRKLVQRHRNVEQMIAQTHTIAIDDDAWLGQVNEMTRGLNADQASRLVYQLAQRYADSGRADLAAETFQILAERYRDQPLAERGVRWLILHHASEEAAWRRRERTSPQVQPARFGIPRESEDRVVAVAFDEPAPRAANNARTPVRHTGRAVALYQLLQRTHPTSAADPQLQLAVAAVQRLNPDARESEATYRQIAGATAHSSARDCALAELWLRDPKLETTKPMASCLRIEQKPFVDGQLDDDIWQSAKPITVGGKDVQSPTIVRIARDGQFLYVCAACPKVSGVDYEPGDEERIRDGASEERDRIELLLDINRDWNTAYRFVIDHRGFASEGVDSDYSWNPNIYIAAAEDSSHWRMEAAIPLEELTPQPPASRDVWALGLQRIVPTVGIQSWPASDAVLTPVNAGLLLHE